MKKDKPMIFRSLNFTVSGQSVAISSDGVRNLLSNLSLSIDVSQCKSSNPADTFKRLVGAGYEVELNKVARAALAAAAEFASNDTSLLDAFVLGEPQRLALVKPNQIDVLLKAASGFGYTEAVRALVATKPSASTLDNAVWMAAQCGRTEALKVLLEAGAYTTFETDVRSPTSTTFPPCI